MQPATMIALTACIVALQWQYDFSHYGLHFVRSSGLSKIQSTSSLETKNSFDSILCFSCLQSPTTV